MCVCVLLLRRGYARKIENWRNILCSKWERPDPWADWRIFKLPESFFQRVTTENTEPLKYLHTDLLKTNQSTHVWNPQKLGQAGVVAWSTMNSWKINSILKVSTSKDSSKWQKALSCIIKSTALEWPINFKGSALRTGSYQRQMCWEGPPIKSGAHLLSQGCNWDPYYRLGTFAFILT